LQGVAGFAQFIANQREDIAMHFCLTGQYSPQALNNIMDSPIPAQIAHRKIGDKYATFRGFAVDGVPQ
jgi:hypothetical protein